MNGNNEFFALLDAAGQMPSKVNDQLVKAINVLHPSHPALAYVLRAAQVNSELGDQKLKALETWGKAGDVPAAAPTGLPPGQVVADVGGLPADQGAFDGQLNPTLMTGPNWGYYARQNLGAQSGHIFDRPFVIGDANTGSTFDAGTLAAFQNSADPIVRDAQGNQVADLSQWG